MATSRFDLPGDEQTPRRRDAGGARAFDVVVIGAGPAGVAAVAAAVEAGRRVALIDSGRQPGGQYGRRPFQPADEPQPHSTPPPQFRVDHGRKPLNPAGKGAFAHDQHGIAGATYLPEHDVWAVARDDDGFVVHALRLDETSASSPEKNGSDETEVVLRAAALVLASGAYDRQLPFPGWDLPGVYTAGGVQALLKEHRVAAGRRVVVGGTGPFLLPVVAELAKHGVDVPLVAEANRPNRWLQNLPAVARAPGKLIEGAHYLAALARHRVPFRTRTAVVAAHGTKQVEAVTVARLNADWTVVSGSTQAIECDAVAVGWGFTPRLELPLSLGCATRVDVDGSLVIEVNARQATSVPGVYAAGEVCGVGGADLASIEGRIAGRAAAQGPHPGVRLLRRRTALRAFAAAMHRVYPVHDGWTGWLPPDTIVCRCEEVTVADVGAAVHELGAADARTVKLFCRTGMGWCQGRICGYPTSVLTAAESGRPVDQRGMAERPLAVPVPLGLLARQPARKEDTQ